MGLQKEKVDMTMRMNFFFFFFVAKKRNSINI